MKVSAFLVAACLVACQELPPDDPGSDDPGMDPMDPPGDDPGGDPGEDPYLADINNTWQATDGGLSFFLQATRLGSSGVIRGIVANSPLVDGVYYNRMIRLTAMLGSTIMTLDGMFIDAGTIHLTVKESQAQIILICTKSGQPCFP